MSPRHFTSRSVAMMSFAALFASVPVAAMAHRVERVITTTPEEQVIYAFGANAYDGAFPYAGVIADASGVLYGTTAGGGASEGYGTVFKVAPSPSGYLESVLWSFQSVESNTGSVPLAGVIEDRSGNLYGTTSEGGGSMYYGTAYKLAPHGKRYDFSLLIDFYAGGSSPYGDGPLGGLNFGARGNIYGSTSFGGGGCGVSLDLTTLAVLHTFGCRKDGRQPAAAMIADADGNLYGTTQYGGTGPCTYGCGIAFKLTRSGSSWTETVLHDFQGGATDGSHPLASLVRGPEGTLFGTTHSGGTHGKGVVYALTPTNSGYREGIIHSFAGSLDGARPRAPLIMVGYSLYGTTTYGGTFGRGTVFRLKPSHGNYVESIVYAFRGGADGAYPLGGLLDENGLFFGTTAGGGRFSKGTVFTLKM